MDRKFGKRCLILKTIPLLHARDDFSALGPGRLLDPSVHEIAVGVVFGSGRRVTERKVAFARLLRFLAGPLLGVEQHGSLARRLINPDTNPFTLGAEDRMT